MKNKINYYFNNIVNPLLYYIDKNGNSVFRNFCLFQNNGNLYNKVIPIKEAGHILEARIELAKKIKIYNILLTVIIYLMFLHTMYSFKGLLLYEFVWIILFFCGRLYAAGKYKKMLNINYGEYCTTEFLPPIAIQKKKEYKNHFIARLIVLAFALVIFAGFGIGLINLIKFNVNKESPNYNTAEILSDIYLKIYPPQSIIYEIRAFEDYISGDFENATINYIKVFNMNGKKFTDNDYTLFANLLYLVKKSNGSQNAIDVFNEYATQKDITIQQQAKLLWIKSMFSVANGITDFIKTDYDDLIASLDKKDSKNKFYILSDEAYILYLAKDYKAAIKIYNAIIPYAKEHKDTLGKEIPKLLVERGFAKKKMNDKSGANSDFLESKISIYEVKNYEPQIVQTQFITRKF